MSTTPGTIIDSELPQLDFEAKPASEVRKDVLLAAFVAVALGLLYHFTYGNYNLNMRDEGYLWYGVQQVLAGDIPLRDFQSYDPGRYYWCAWLSPIFGTGIVGVRAALVTFAVLGLFAGLLVARRFVPHRSWLIVVGLALGLSMFPRHKLFEPAIVMIAAWSTTRLIERPSSGRAFCAGLVIGLATVFGRNHGIYLVAAYSVLFLISLAKRLDPKPWRSAGALTLGVIVGYAPVLAMLALVPNFADAFIEALLSIKTVGSNIVAPYLWPWTTSTEAELQIVNEHWIVPIGKVVLHGAYLLPVILLPLGLFVILRCDAKTFRRHGALAATVLLGCAYTYHYAVRSDVPHLFQAIQPVLLCGLGLSAYFSQRALWRGVSLALLLAGSCLLALTEHPELKHAISAGHAQNRMDLEIHGDVLRVPENLGRDIEMVRKVVQTVLPADEEIFILPTMPTYYPILGKRSPSWWIYMLWHNSETEQQKIIADLKAQKISVIITIARPFNRDPAFNLNETNPLLWKFILTDYKRVEFSKDLPMPLRIHLWVHQSKI